MNIFIYTSSVGRGAPVRVRAGAQRGPGRVAAAAPLELLPHPRPGHHPSPGEEKNKTKKTTKPPSLSRLIIFHPLASKSPFFRRFCCRRTHTC